MAALVWLWQGNPFVQPLVQRSQAELLEALDRAVALRANADWLNAELKTAVEGGDLDRAALLAGVAANQVPPVALDPALTARVATLEAEAQASAVRDCAVCMVEAGSCRSLTHIGLCLVPFELTPAGDLNALRQEGQSWLTGGDVDELTVGLAIVGLGGTAAVLVTGGSSATGKAGATAMRVARRIGALSPRFLGQLTDLARLNVRAGALSRYVVGAGSLDTVLDVARLERLKGVGTDLTKVAENTSVAEALVLLRHVDSPKDAARLAKVSEAAGKNTRTYVEVLGGKRVFAKLVRLTDAALTASILIYAALLQVLLGFGQWLGVRGLRGLAVLIRPA